jgi:hypothetical protein
MQEYQNINARYCINCGNYGHRNKFCKEPVSSYGIILIKFDYDEIKNIFNDNIAKSHKIYIDNGIITDISNKNIKLHNMSDIHMFSILQNHIKFLMICRKHTLGFSEFIRGNYDPNNIEGTMFLFQQMVAEEIESIRVNSDNFAILWEKFWMEPTRKTIFEKDYKKAKLKFEQLKTSNDMTLNDYINKITPLWKFPEWGFPKGRRNKTENNIVCAVREFEEETGYTKNDYILLEGIKPLVEDFTGTNAVRYRHVYYLACSSSDKTPLIDSDNRHQAPEIGNIGYYTFNEIYNLIRPHHTERKLIIEKIFMYTCEKILNELNTENKS